MALRALFLLVFLASSSLAVADSFSFIALGDMPYYKKPEDKGPADAEFKALIAAINERRPDFTLHIGDTKSGGTACGRALLEEQRDLMNTFEAPLVYTPGDNEWTDCKTDSTSNPRQQLRLIRELYFPRAISLGRKPIPLERQADLMPETAALYVENSRFRWKDVMVVTAHVAGSNNGLEAHDLDAVREFFDRDQAVRAWLENSFAQAEEAQAKAIVVALHGDIFRMEYKDREDGVDYPRHSGHKNVAETLVKLARRFAKPVLVVYGDSHKFEVLRPYPKAAPNVIAAQVYGDKDINAAEITVNPEIGGVFSVGSVLPNPPN